MVCPSALTVGSWALEVQDFDNSSTRVNWEVGRVVLASPGIFYNVPSNLGWKGQKEGCV